MFFRLFRLIWYHMIIILIQLLVFQHISSSTFLIVPLPDSLPLLLLHLLVLQANFVENTFRIIVEIHTQIDKHTHTHIYYEIRLKIVHFYHITELQNTQIVHLCVDFVDFFFKKIIVNMHTYMQTQIHTYLCLFFLS